MIQIFTGDDRVRAGNEIKQILGENYEVIDCADLTPKDLPQIFRGSTFFEAHRKILLRDFTANKSIFDRLPQYLDTKHDVILLETKIDKRTAAYKEIKNKVQIKEFNLPPATDFRIVFDIYKVAKRDGSKAVEMLRKIETTEDPIRFTGLLASQALKDYTENQGTKNQQILKNLSKLDIALKSSKIEPWLLVESFLLKVR